MKIFLTDISDMNDDIMNKGLKLVPAYRKDKIERYRFMEDKERSLAAGLLLNYATKFYSIDMSYAGEIELKTASDDIFNVKLDELVKSYDTSYDYNIEYAGNGKLVIHMGEINDLGGISLSLFLGMAMITLKLWQLASLALPLVILLVAQVVLIILYTYFVVFNVMGRDYDAAVLVAGTCGFGMGATPNAMANMQALCDKYAPSVKAYLIIPLIGSLFADFLNSLVITLFINLL